MKAIHLIPIVLVALFFIGALHGQGQMSWEKSFLIGTPSSLLLTLSFYFTFKKELL